MENRIATIKESTLTGIANAIRAKDGSSDAMLPSEMAAKIEALPTGGSGGWLKQPWRDDGKLHVWIVVSRVDTEKDRRFVIRTYDQNVVIDWGDGTSSASLHQSDNIHDYESPGVYEVVFNSSSYTGMPAPWFSGYTGSGVATYQYSLDKIKQIEVGNCTSIGGNATFGPFWCCSSLEYIKWSTNVSVTAVPIRCFFQCLQLREVEGLEFTTVADYGFSECKQLNFAPSNAVTRVGQYAFNACTMLTSAKIPTESSYTTIEAYAFQNCLSLEEIEIPANITYIAYGAFGSCSSLKKIVFKSVTPPTLQATACFSLIPANCVVTVPRGCLSAYQNAANYTPIKNYMVEEA